MLQIGSTHFIDNALEKRVTPFTFLPNNGFVFLCKIFEKLVSHVMLMANKTSAKSNSEKLSDYFKETILVSIMLEQH